jgi:HKD family nuclease
MALLVLQSPSKPTEILTSLEALASPAATELRIAVAYATKTGCDELLPRLIDRIGLGRWATMSKTAIVSTDFHITEPAALAALRDEGFAVRLSNTPGSSFHPKVYTFASKRRVKALVGSANLTRAALTVNTEAAAVVSGVAGDFDASWAELVAASVALTQEILDRYEQQRKKAPPKVYPDPISPPSAPLARASVVFPDAVFGGVVDPAKFDAMWIEAGSMSSSESHAQLELPRGSNRFFGFNFQEHDRIHVHHTIGVPVLFSGGKAWRDRPLTWHGDNAMERLNLPTAKQGGFAYRNTAILFRRRRGRFQIAVAPWNSSTAATWREASARIGQRYKLGKRTSRTCGLF